MNLTSNMPVIVGGRFLFYEVNFYCKFFISLIILPDSIHHDHW